MESFCVFLFEKKNFHGLKGMTGASELTSFLRAARLNKKRESDKKACQLTLMKNRESLRKEYKTAFCLSRNMKRVLP